MTDSEFEFTQSDTFGTTDIGKRRSINQDQFLIAELSKSMLVSASSLPDINAGRFFGGMQGQVLLVADGMGGHAAGEKASSLALQHLVGRLLNSVHWFFQSDTDSEADFINALQNLLRDAHGRILAESQEHLENAGMGTTLTMAYIHWPTMYVVHVGDSRCYLIRGGVAKQVTTDHTLARQMVEAGGMKPEEEATSRWSNVLWNVLGGHSERELLAEVHRVDLQHGDSVVLCSDGLYRYLDEVALAEMVDGEPDASVLCRQLVHHANESGGEDNITVVVSHPKASRPRPKPEHPIQSDPACSETYLGPLEGLDGLGSDTEPA
ncbi:serine/threonine-protein phosphatase [Roseiconus nitratireducens]|uniref:Serine/threonine-protein phosphatase n=1 Tax=Roseiconus nitratireducens TaxID=2605748 RepID=A0A5M6DAM0_9BACT|nr:protein phosphatase 2C domain-containing protein [Roseiconus nitratireducens]KAA5544591.1 serine/threonine-protein phosphatase [Roseiconus nitratireducens]